MKLVNLITLENPGKFSALDQESADKYNTIELTTKPIIRTHIKSEFEQALLDDTGYSDENIPAEEIKIVKTLGDIVFTTVVKPTTKRPGYKEVFTELVKFLEFTQAAYYKGDTPKGVLTIKEEPYIILDTVIEQLSSNKDIAIAGKAGFSTSISYTSQKEIEAPNTLGFSTTNNYKLLTGNNAMDYVLADKLNKIADEFSSEFEAAIEDLSQWNQDNIPKETQKEFRQIGNFVYILVSKPTKSVGYGAIISNLIKPFKQRITKSTGELIRIKEQFESNELDSVTIENYQPKIRDGNIYVSLNRLANRIHSLKAVNTEDTIEQKIRTPIYLK